MANAIKMKAIEFKVLMPQAKRVSVAGSFNNWKTDEFKARKDTNGLWKAKVSLKPGKHEYKFFVDNNWALDPKCANTAYNAFGSQNSIIEVK